MSREGGGGVYIMIPPNIMMVWWSTTPSNLEGSTTSGPSLGAPRRRGERAVRAAAPASMLL